jgi:hypothetical protein
MDPATQRVYPSPGELVSGVEWIAPLRALLIGAANAPPPESGIVARPWPSIDVSLPGAFVGQPLRACRDGLAEFDTTPLTWADIVVFRNSYATAATCQSCAIAATEEATLVDHALKTGHEWRRPYEGLVRGLVEALDRQPQLLRGRALVYELDLDPWSREPAVVEHEGVALELDFVRLLLRTADLVVARTPEAASAARREGAREIALVASHDGDSTRAAAWRRAAARAGIGRLVMSGASADTVVGATRTAAWRLDHRLRFRSLDEAAAVAIAGRRTGSGVCWNEADAIDPLVSVVIPVVDEPSPLVESAIRSALDIEGVRVEVIVAALPGTGGADAIARVADARVRCVEVAEPPTTLDLWPGSSAWDESARGAAMAVAHDAARGTWLAPLEPRSVFVRGRIPLLLSVAIEHGLEIVYGRTLLASAGQVIGQVGSWPPGPDSIAHDAALIAGALRAIRPDAEAWREGEDATWNLWRRYLELGARTGNIEDTVTVRDVPEPALLHGAA